MLPPALQRLVADSPKLHVGLAGELISHWRPDRKTIIELDRRLKPGMKTLETGAGFTTIMFAIYGCRHTAIAPDRGLFERIQTYCRENDISTADIEFIENLSVDVLPKLSADLFDLALIDGCHGFPTVYVDFLYMARALKLGGTLIVDDMNIFTCQTVGRFMQADPSWRVDIATKRVVFGVKVEETGGVLREWHMQKFVRDRSTASSLKARLATYLGFY